MIFFLLLNLCFLVSSHWSHFCFLTVAWACKWPAFCVPTLSGKLIFPNYRVSIHLDFIWSHFRYLPIPYTPWTLTVRPWKWAKKTPPNSENDHLLTINFQGKTCRLCFREGNFIPLSRGEAKKAVSTPLADAEITSLEFLDVLNVCREYWHHIEVQYNTIYIYM